MPPFNSSLPMSVYATDTLAPSGGGGGNAILSGAGITDQVAWFSSPTIVSSTPMLKHTNGTGVGVEPITIAAGTSTNTLPTTAVQINDVPLSINNFHNTGICQVVNTPDNGYYDKTMSLISEGLVKATVANTFNPNTQNQVGLTVGSLGQNSQPDAIRRISQPASWGGMNYGGGTHWEDGDNGNGDFLAFTPADFCVGHNTTGSTPGYGTIGTLDIDPRVAGEKSYYGAFGNNPSSYMAQKIIPKGFKLTSASVFKLWGGQFIDRPPIAGEPVAPSPDILTDTTVFICGQYLSANFNHTGNPPDNLVVPPKVNILSMPGNSGGAGTGYKTFDDQPLTGLGAGGSPAEFVGDGYAWITIYHEVFPPTTVYNIDSPLMGATITMFRC